MSDKTDGPLARDQNDEAPTWHGEDRENASKTMQALQKTFTHVFTAYPSCGEQRP